MIPDTSRPWEAAFALVGQFSYHRVWANFQKIRVGLDFLKGIGVLERIFLGYCLLISEIFFSNFDFSQALVLICGFFLGSVENDQSTCIVCNYDESSGQKKERHTAHIPSRLVLYNFSL